ncbi:hypothetical protein MKW94_009190 [Papaver nudicaule]|uniref:FACT complex subunit n=1 Tax=Papaver nudicaule TaxID=74823 RepID=A0AA41VYN9_PAPNU|nr:hypothetical protein [Papaver nudicaule]
MSGSSKFGARCDEAAKKEAYNRHLRCKCTKDQVEEYVRSYLEEERHKVNQAILGVQLDRETARRLLSEAQSKTTNTLNRKIRRRRKLAIPTKKRKRSGAEGCCDGKLQMDIKPAELTGVTIFPNQGGETIVGTLEAHVYGFVYATPGSHFRVRFMYEEVKEAFLRVEDEKLMMPPLLHFQLHHPIKVGIEKTKDIQFRLMSTPVGPRISDDDKIADEMQTRDWGRNNDLKNFVDKVLAKWTLGSGTTEHFFFHTLDKRDEFHGVLHPSNALAVFNLTSFSLVVLADTQTIVVDLYKIEIVNLATLTPDEIDMTVVFKDFKRDLLQINSIPFHLLDRIKACLDWADVKYYVNATKPDWKSIVKGIVDSPETFIKQGGWKFFDLEDPATIRYYLQYILEESSDSDDSDDEDEWD